MHGGAGKANELIRRGVPNVAGLELAEQFRLLRQAIERHGDGIAGRVVACRNQQTKEILKGQIIHGRRISLRQHARKNAICIKIGFFVQDAIGVVKQLNPCGGAEGHEAIGVCVHLIDERIGEIGIGIAD